MAAEGRGQFRHDVRDASEIEGGFPKAFGFLVWGLWLQERTEYCSPMHTTLPWKDIPLRGDMGTGATLRVARSKTLNSLQRQLSLNRVWGLVFVM